MIEEHTRNGHGMLDGRRLRQAPGTEIQERSPALRAAGLARRAGTIREDSLDSGEVSADDAGVEILVPELGMPLKKSFGGVAVHHLEGSAAHSPVGTRVVQERRHACRTIGLRTRLRHARRGVRDRGLERPPVLVAALARQRMLNVAQARRAGRVRVRARQPCPSVGVCWRAAP